MNKPMNITEFSIEVPGKWVLSGEHSVLRGKNAIAFPYPAVSLKLSYRSLPDPSPALTITANPFQEQIRILIGRALDWLKVPHSALGAGEIDIQSQIPMGAGLGSSAALCVALSRFMIWKVSASGVKSSIIPNDRPDFILHQWIALATHLEDFFHGKSSGMDVNVIAHSRPIFYSIEKRAELFLPEGKTPRFELYDSGKRSHTKEVIEKVNLWKQASSPELVAHYDKKMNAASELAKEGLIQFQTDTNSGEAKIAQAMNQAQDCFEAWGLVTPELMEQKRELLKQGALAVKMTGAGLGGYWVGVWGS